MKTKIKEPKANLAEKTKSQNLQNKEVTEPTTSTDTAEAEKVKEQSGENPIGTPP